MRGSGSKREMKVLIVFGLGISTVFSQTNLPAGQKAGDCSINIVGNRNTGTVTCSNVDKKLAEQITQLVTASKRDGKTLKDIASKLDTLLKDVESKPTISITSVNQLGGITAGQVTINQNGPPERRILQEQKNSLIVFLAEFHSKIRVSAAANDAESYQFAQDWYEVLKAANWQMQDNSVRSMLFTGTPQRGILMKFHGEPVPPGVLEIPMDTPEGHLAAALQKVVDKNVTVQRYAEDFISLEVGLHPK
jgi:hypothetical protein